MSYWDIVDCVTAYTTGAAWRRERSDEVGKPLIAIVAFGVSTTGRGVVPIVVGSTSIVD